MSLNSNDCIRANVASPDIIKDAFYLQMQTGVQTQTGGSIPDMFVKNKTFTFKRKIKANVTVAISYAIPEQLGKCGERLALINNNLAL